MNNRELIISAAGSRYAEKWPKQKIWWTDFIEKLKNPVQSLETLAEFLKMPKAQQDNLKDVGGYVGGSLKDDRRLGNNVISRDIISLDLDNIPSGGTKAALQKISILGCAYAVYSTRKHEEIRPRLRVLIPTNRSISAEEYEPLARKLAEMITLEWADPTTFQASRLMYWPSISRDSQYVLQYETKEFLDVDACLKLYEDWHDHSQWPRMAHETENFKKLADKQQDPESKSGIVGAFCKTYDIYSAIDTFLPGVYLTTEHEDRLTFAGGSTFGGAVVYDGKFLYSHHATDPASMKLCNAWDLVRVHKFNDLDYDARPGTPTHKLPSFTAMTELAVQDSRVTTLLNREKYNNAVDDFEVPEGEFDWLQKLQVSKTTGTVEKTIDNILVILENDPLLMGKLACDEFANRGLALGALPWNKSDKKRDWADIDDAGLRHYLEKVYGITGKEKIYDASGLCALKNTFNDVKKYLTELPAWDGVERLNKLFIDYLGAEDNKYVREVAKKSFVAAVARAMTPGVKYDHMPILSGPQGIGKSTLLRIMSRNWFNDSLVTFEGKEASEVIQGSWIVEVGELSGMSKSETNIVKQFISKTSDKYREAYGRRTGEFPRKCVFFGTTNESEFLRDATGNRRFWPVDVGEQQPVKSVFKDLEKEVDLIWSEAFFYWQMGESLYLCKEIEELAREEQENHMELSDKEGAIVEFMLRELPENWNAYTIDQRKSYWAFDYKNYVGQKVKRDRICVAEIWIECFGKDIGSIRKFESIEISGILKNLKGVERIKTNARFGCHGFQKGFKVLDRFHKKYNELNSFD